MACVSTYYSGIMAAWGPGFWVITYNKAVYYTCACIILDNVDMIERHITGKNIGFPGHLLSGMHTGNPEKNFLIWKSKCKSHVSCEECWHILMLRKLSVILKERCHFLPMAFPKCRKFLELQWTFRILIMTCCLIISKQKEWQLQHFLHKDNKSNNNTRNNVLSIYITVEFPYLS